MNLAIVVYLIGLASNLSALAVFLLIAGGIVLLAFTMYGYAEDEFEKVKPSMIKITKYWIIPSVIVLALVPTKTDMYIMTGLVVGEKIIQTEKGNEILDKSYELLTSKIDEVIKENTETKEKNDD